MTGALFRAMLLAEGRMRLRRGTSHVVLLAFTVIAWFMIAYPSTGFTMLAANSVRVAYNSTGLALGSSMMSTILLGLFGFYLVRGRVDEDLRSGMGAVLAATPVRNASLVVGRWASGVLYLGTLVAALALTTIVLQAVRGDGAPEPVVYLKMHVLAILPNILFVAGMAALCESHPPLMGKLGDVLYFMFWIGQVIAATLVVEWNRDSVALLAFDTTGMGVLSARAAQLLHTHSLAFGMNTFDKALPPIFMADNFWTWPMVLTRAAATLLALIPLAIAARLFHRYTPDRVAPSKARKSWAVGEGINRMLRPLDVCSRLLLRFSARLPRTAGLLAAELALTLAANRLAGPLLLAFLVAGAVLDYTMLPGLLLAAVACWGIMIADVSVADFRADTEHMGAAAWGGSSQRYWRQSAAVILLGSLLCATIAARWAAAEPLRALCLASGVVAFAGLAQLLGRTTRTGRAFTVLFLLSLYLSTQATDLAALDLLGTHGKATLVSIARQFLAGIALLAAGFAYNRQRGLR